MKKIVIVDDHQIVRTGLKALISEINGVEVVAEAADGKEFFDKALVPEPDLLILDISMPVMNGIEVLEELNKTGRKLNVLMVSMHGEYSYIKRCLDLGASGFIFKDEEDEEYYKAIEKTLRGEQYLTPKCLRLMEMEGSVR